MLHNGRQRGLPSNSRHDVRRTEAEVNGAASRHSGPKAADGMAVEEDVVCNACGSGDQGDSILLCDSCDAGWHIECLEVSTPHALQTEQSEDPLAHHQKAWEELTL